MLGGLWQLASTSSPVQAAIPITLALESINLELADDQR